MSYSIRIICWIKQKNVEESHSYWMWKDAEKNHDCKFIYPPKWCRNKFVMKIHEKTYKNSLAQKLWFRIYLHGSRWKKSNNNILITSDYNPWVYTPAFFEWVKKKYHAKIALCCLNILRGKRNPKINDVSLYDVKKRVDIVYSSDPEDAKRFGLSAFESIYSAVSDYKKPQIKQDLFYVGADKGRAPILLAICKQLQGVKMLLHLVGDRKYIGKYKVLGHYVPQNAAFLPYQKVVQNILESNCILDIVENGQKGMTLRWPEALTYNKKLLTNNENIRSHRYYNPEYVQIFRNVNEIDIEFVKKRTNVDYGYQGDYNPQKFVRRIVKELVQQNN